MKKLHLFILCSFVSLTLSAQKVYFIYIQAENEQPFFVKLNKKVIHSSPAGYIILPKLVDSTYSFTIGSPQNQFTEQKFTVAVNKKDHGFLLKNLPEKGWGLFDLQNEEVHMATNAAVINSSETVSVTAFTEILSKAADDPTIKEKVQRKQEIIPAVATDTVVTEPVAPVVNTPAVLSNTDTGESTGKKSKRKNRKSTDTKVEKSTEESITQVPVNTPEGKVEEIKPEAKDTIAITDTKSESKTEAKVENKPAVKDTVVTEPRVEVKTESKETIPAVEDKKEEKSDPVNVSTEKNEANIPVQDTKSQPVEEKKPVSSEPKSEITSETKKENKDLDDSRDKDTADKTSDEKKDSKKQAKKKGDKYKASEVKKYSESSTTEGFGLVFIDKSEEGKDTIRLTIPNPKPVVAVVTDEPKEEKKFLELNVDDGKTTSTAKTEVTAPTSNTVSNSSRLKVACDDLASDEEFARLRKKMAGEVENKMLGEAKKFFKSKCFSTRQIQVLGRLFETDEARYNFFDEAYKHVSDPENFSVLQSDLQDPYYSGRFKAMLRN